jgi:hypothetical protein
MPLYAGMTVNERLVMADWGEPPGHDERLSRPWGRSSSVQRLLEIGD